MSRSSSSPEPSDDVPDHAGLVPDEIHDLIRRAHWQSAKSVEDVGGACALFNGNNLLGSYT